MFDREKHFDTDVEVSESMCAFYVFVLEDELYALEASKTREIKVGYQDPIESTPPISSFVIGTMQLEQEVVPVIDFSLRLGIKTKVKNSQTKTMIVAETVFHKQEKKCGIVVDSLLNITNIRTRDIINTPLYKPDIKQYFISNQFSDSKEIIKILDIDVLLAEIELFV